MCKMSVFRVFIRKIALGEVTVFAPFYRKGVKAEDDHLLVYHQETELEFNF